MQGFAINYIPNGALIVLLQQSAIPISMYMSKICLGARYRLSQYTGAVIVLLGILVVLIPTFRGTSNIDDDGGVVATTNVSKGTQLLWIIVLVISCIPMSFSSVYKEMALGEQEIGK